jgi:indole-3-glycerol phosphate synthase
MPDFLDTLARDAKETVSKGYYEHAGSSPRASPASLKAAIWQSSLVPVIAEIKIASPSAGTIRKDIAPEKIALAMVKGGATAISVLTEPKHFNGSLEYLLKVRNAVDLPVLMKDIVVSLRQLAAASQVGADVVLLIQALFDRGYCERGLDEMIAEAHSRHLEVLLEAHNADEFRRAVNSDANLVGINNRNLGTLKVDLNVTKAILEKTSANGKFVVSESGIHTPEDVRFLRGCGAKAFLIGSVIMTADNVEAKVREFVQAY